MSHDVAYTFCRRVDAMEVEQCHYFWPTKCICPTDCHVVLYTSIVITDMAMCWQCHICIFRSHIHEMWKRSRKKPGIWVCRPYVIRRQLTGALHIFQLPIQCLTHCTLYQRTYTEMSSCIFVRLFSRYTDFMYELSYRYQTMSFYPKWLLFVSMVLTLDRVSQDVIWQLHCDIWYLGWSDR